MTVINRALLEVIATKLATSIESVDDYVKKTLLYHSIDPEELSQMVESTLEDLKATGLISYNKESQLAATLVGQATVVSSLTPEDGIFVHDELRKALKAFVMDGEMHILYLFTPVHEIQANVNWQVFLREVEFLNESDMRALNFIGLKPSMINKMSVSQALDSICNMLTIYQGTRWVHARINTRSDPNRPHLQTLLHRSATSRSLQ